jgi:hypothetical protein
MAVPPNIEQLREARAWWEDATYIWEDATYIPEYDDAISDALDWLLSVLDEGGRLVVEKPCEHGALEPHGWVCGAHDWDEKCSRQNCEAHLDFGDHCAWLHRNDDACWSASACPGGSRRVVWPTDKEER